MNIFYNFTRINKKSGSVYAEPLKYLAVL